MKTETTTAIVQRMLALVDQGTAQIGDSGELTVSDYTCADRLAREKAVLFSDYPLLVGHKSQLAQPGQYFTLDAAGVPLLLNRDREGQLHAFLNSCRHRGAKVVWDEQGNARAFKCPYHAWSYLDDGSLKFVPREEAFPNLDKASLSLREVPLAESAGFLWVQPGGGAFDVSVALSGVDADLEFFGLAEHVVRSSAIQRPRCNWKLVIDAFSEGYHLKSLHKDSVEPFFLAEGTVFDQMGLHSRSVGARRELLQARDLPTTEWDFRAWTTPFYTLFPNTVLVFHPDWISRITVFPEGVDQCRVHHDMLVPADADLQASYWDRTFTLINDQVFAAEDIAACESIQAAARSGADDTWRVGGLETPVLWFHQACERALA